MQARGCTGDAQSRTHARTPNGHRACALDAHATLPREEMAVVSAWAGGVRGPWRRAPVETPAVGRCRQRVLQVAAVGKLFGCHIPGDTPCSHNCMLHSRCCMLQVAVVDRRFPGVTCMPQWRHVCPRRKCCEGTRCEPTALGLGLAQYTLVCLWLTDGRTAARVLSANVRCNPHHSVRNRI